MNELALENVTLPKEKTYFTLVLIFSILCWLLVVLSVFGLFYAGIFGIAFWFGHGLVIGHLRSEGVRVSDTQLPGLHAALRDVCTRLNLAEIPALYVVQSGGILNAFATRFLGRDFVVVYSDMLEAHGEDSARMKFILGHEVGHIKRGHILKHLFLLPGMLLPLLGTAYSRACEATCDRHGALACGDLNGAIDAIMTLSGGKSAGLQMSSAAFAEQHYSARGFFVSLHELTSGYPTLSQRVANLAALRDASPARQAERHPLAYLVALVTVGGRASGGANALVTIAIVAMLAAIAMPAFVRARERALEIRKRQGEEKVEAERKGDAAPEPTP